MRPPLLIGAAAAAVALVGVATVVIRLSAPGATEVVRALEGVEGLELLEENRGRPGADPCRVSAVLLGTRPRDVHGRIYAAPGRAEGITLLVHEFAGPRGAEDGLRQAAEQLSQCRGFRSADSDGNEFRFEYGGMREADVGSRGYVVSASGGTPAARRLRIDFRAFVFRRGPFLLAVAWQSTAEVSEAALACLAERADAAARGDEGPACSAAPTITAGGGRSPGEGSPVTTAPTKGSA